MVRTTHLVFSTVRHSLGAVTEGFLVAALIALVAVALSPVYSPARTLSGTESAFAAKGGGYSITLVTGTTLAATAVTYGSAVTTLAQYGKVDPAYARLQCFASDTTVTALAKGASVYDVFKSVREGTWNTDGLSTFDTTSSPAWTGGGADCTASLMTYTMHNADRVWKVLATTSFVVQP